MSEIKDGGSAFPYNFDNGDPDNYMQRDEGMTLRDYFAGMAMQGFLSNPAIRHEDSEREANEDDLAEAAYKVANAMLAERSK